MKITLNGRPAQLEENRTLSELLTKSGVDVSARGVAVAVNEVVVTRSQWETHRLREGDRVEVIQAVAGG